MRGAVMSPIGDWRNVKPVGDPIQLTFDQTEDERDNAGMIFDELCREIEHTIHMQVVEAFRVAKLNPRYYLDARDVFSLITKTVVKRVAYPRTVREAKARPKGNRGNRRRVYGSVTVRLTMPTARIARVVE